MDAINTLFSQSDPSLLGTASPAMSSFAKQLPVVVVPASGGPEETLRKTGGAGGGVLNEPFYVMRELPGD